MRIIKIGNNKIKEYFKTCIYCDTEFSYNDSDVKPDFRDGDYVICPVCGKFLFHGEPPKNVDRSKDC